MIDLQDFYSLKDIIVSPGISEFFGKNCVIEDVNKLLCKGWVLLKISTFT